jgi:hypothetical protein
MMKISIITVMISCLFLISCSKDSPEPEVMNECFDENFFSEVAQRKFKMGFSTWSYGSDTEDTNTTYSFINENADIYSEQVDDVIPWNSWINDLPLPDQFVAIIEDKVSRKIPNHQLLLSISLLNTDRDNLIEGFDGKVPEYDVLNDEAIQSAYLKHLKYLIDKLTPDYLILAMEANDLYLKDANTWLEYKLLMKEIRAEIRNAYPSIQISESITLHNWYNPVVGNPEAYIAEIASYISNFDFATISFYPFFNGQNSKAQYQEALDFLHSHVNKPIALVETAHLAEDLLVPSINLSLPGDECQQNDYLEVLLENAQKEDYEFVIWWTHRDYDKLWNTFPDELKEIGSLWRDTGLLDQDGKERAAMETWKAAFSK